MKLNNRKVNARNFSISIPYKIFDLTVDSEKGVACVYLIAQSLLRNEIHAIVPPDLLDRMVIGATVSVKLDFGEIKK